MALPRASPVTLYNPAIGEYGELGRYYTEADYLEILRLCCKYRLELARAKLRTGPAQPTGPRPSE